MIDIDFETLQALGLTPLIASRAAQLGAHEPNSRLARVIESQRDCFTLHDGHGELRVRRAVVHEDIEHPARPELRR